ncbi:Spy/CpxP family protein refolding chaperone [Tenacibaculum singaporense]|uniref:Spy/CpxP family protein refolding chaperone n=1 Tax=Tenacibaculum singaporense TaxID=2358479 RepID=UPI001980F830|nr:Spy/CpxP family protein refolding chaperone [Tenacibaculum singaporense]
MKKLLTLLILAVGFTVTTQAQKRDNTKHKELSTEQKTELAVKKLTLQLDLTEAQQKQIKPLIAKQVAERQKMWAKRKAMKESGKKATADERYAMKSHMLDKKIAHKSEMKRILNEQQYERYEKMNARKMKRHKKKATHKKYRKGEHHKKHQEEK